MKITEGARVFPSPTGAAGLERGYAVAEGVSGRMMAVSGMTAKAGVPAGRGAAPRRASVRCAASDPLLVRAAKKEVIERPPVWMMRQAGRYMQEYRDLSEKHPSFRERSETTDLIVEISLQPWRAFKPDGVILFSDILTPLPSIGVPFDIIEKTGPIIDHPFETADDLKRLTPFNVEPLGFVGESLRALRDVVGTEAAVLGFVGSPWTLATYIVEGASTSTYKKVKTMLHNDPAVLKSLLEHVASAVAEYACYQIEAGAQAVQIFDSWGGQLPPGDWERFSGPYIKQIVDFVKAKHPGVPIILYASGSGGLLERMAATGVNVVSCDWSVDLGEARARMGGANGPAVQGNIDPTVLFASKDAITDAIKTCVANAGTTGHILNLGHGVQPSTDEASVAHFFKTCKEQFY